MKKGQFILAILLLSAKLFSQTSGDYRSLISGNWNSILTWETYNGVAWIPALSTPDQTSGTITVRSGNTITVTANVTADQVVVSSGGQITVQSSRTLAIANGSGSDLSVSGTVDNQGTITLSSGADAVYNSGGLYIHNQNGGVVPAATWNASSTCKITGITNSAPTSINQTFYNFTWDCASQTKDFNPNGAFTTVNGSMTIVNTGTKKFILATDVSTTLNIGADLIVTGGTLTLTDKTALPTVIVGGNFSQSGGILEMSRNNATPGVMRIAGNFTYTAGIIQENNGSSAGNIFFQGTSIQYYSAAPTIASTEHINFTINSGATVYAGTNIFTGGGSFTLNNGGTLGIGSADGITLTGATGNVQVSGTRTYGTSANYIYNGTVTQNTGNGLPATVNDLTDNNSNGVVNLNSSVAVNGTLTVVSGGVFRPSASSIVSGTGIMTGSGTVQVTRTTAVPDFNAQYTITNRTLTDLTVDYNAANQVLDNLTYGYLKISGSISPAASNASVNKGFTVTGTFTPTGGTITMNNGSTITNSGTLTFKNLTVPLGATVTTASSFSIDGTLNVGLSGVFNATSLTVSALDNAGITNSGTVNFSSLTVNRPVGGTLNLNGSITVNGTLNFIDGSIALGDYNLTIGSSGSITNASSSKYVITNGTGFLIRNSVGAAAAQFPVGTLTSYNPVTVLNIGVPDNFSVKVQTTFDHSPIDPTRVVNRQWTVNEAVGGGSIAFVSLQFNAGEWAGNFNILNAVTVGRWNGLAWVGYVSALTGTGPYTVTNLTGDPVTSFSPFAAGNEGSLPVSLSHFNSTVSNVRDVKLNWGTTQELNNKGFDIERKNASKPNDPWAKIGFVEGFGTTNETHNYAFEDKKLNLGTFKYRLKQIDYNGNFQYFNLSNDVTIEKPGDYFVSQNYPNPLNPNSKIDYQLPFDAKVSIKLYDLLGREVATIADKQQEAGYYTEIINGSNLASGIYIYKFSALSPDKNFSKTMKLVLLK